MVEVGEPMPKIKLLDTERNKVDITKNKEGKVSVIAFFPGAFTSVCTKEMCTFRDDLAKLGSLNARIFAISVDSPFSNAAFKEKNGLNFVILSDYKRKAVKKLDIQLKDFAGMKGFVAAKRSVFVIDANGTVKYKWISDDPTVEPNYSDVEAAVSSAKQ